MGETDEVGVFWGIAALLLLGALLMLLPPLFRPRGAATPLDARAASLAVHRDAWQEAERDLDAGLIAPAQFAQVRADIERGWLVDAAAAAPAAAAVHPARRSALALALLLPLASVLGYLALGDPKSLTTPAPPTPAAGAAGHAVTPEQIQAMATALAERLRLAPQDVQGWSMLARSYTMLGRYADAVTAYRRAVALAPGDATLLADHADVLAMTQGRKLGGEPARLVQQALDADPRHAKALALAGSVAFEANDYGAARGYWQRLLAVAPPDSAMARSARGSIAQAERMEQLAQPGATATQTPAAVAAAPTAPAAAAPADANAAAGTRTLSGEVRLSPALAARVAPGDTLFVFARAAEGSRMPLAVLRRPVGAWPAPFVLDDSSAMTPQRRLSGADRVIVGARVSRTGNATPQRGDLLGESGVVAPGVHGLTLLIDRAQP